LELAVEAGLDRDEVDKVLDSDAYVEAVREDEALAASYGISGVPFFVLDRTFAISGAQPPETLVRVLDHAWSESKKLDVLVPDSENGPGCEGDACEF
jgi:protein disulfide-isomerase